MRGPDKFKKSEKIQEVVSEVERSSQVKKIRKNERSRLRRWRGTGKYKKSEKIQEVVSEDARTKLLANSVLELATKVVLAFFSSWD
ncbi:hypothetical protein DAPPUDRAFT_340731 [Daphnia pulex]|uniref:Uncharacterized protein n=1 Tax=Daphnia pulex TaxID=6669 RepID=E9I4N4_DAPPU|nr:hypothetical protein DAPPUDRAFT_340731 [Daphnia pulex]|eukprot:EFX61046.1 hypothetical protein DAPPUDRAFT_340731 [Daphnia pulex]